MSNQTKPTSHTPGPWTTEPKDGVMAVYGRRKDVPVCLTDGRDQDETEANAQLIAAAPDLLAACQAMRDGWGKNLTEPMALVNAAIEKATQ